MSSHLYSKLIVGKRVSSVSGSVESPTMWAQMCFHIGSLSILVEHLR